MNKEQAAKRAHTLLVGIYHGLSFFDEREELVVREALTAYYQGKVNPPVGQTGSIQYEEQISRRAEALQ
jgi:hypothetical protein